MRDVINSMLDLTQKQSEAWTKRHNEIMTEIHATHEEIRDLIILQKEHRIDIMALFQSQKNLRERVDNLENEKS